MSFLRKKKIQLLVHQIKQKEWKTKWKTEGGKEDGFSVKEGGGSGVKGEGGE